MLQCLQSKPRELCNKICKNSIDISYYITVSKWYGVKKNAAIKVTL